MISKFGHWTGSTLSFAGCRCLINSVIASSLVHLMMIYRWPHSLIGRFEQAMRNFLWTGDTARQGFICVSWSKCCMPFAHGGLGIRSIRLANEAFLCKFAWDILCRASPSTDLIFARYFYRTGTPCRFIRFSSIWSGLWRYITRLTSGSRWIIGHAASQVCFWTDNCLGYVIADHLRLPDDLISTLSYTVGDVLFDGIWHFDEVFFAQFPEIVVDILRTPVSFHGDRQIWADSTSGNLTAKAAYSLVQDSTLRVSWASWIWGTFIPPCQSMTVWCAIWGKLPTGADLIRIGIAGPFVPFVTLARTSSSICLPTAPSRSDFMMRSHVFLIFSWSIPLVFSTSSCRLLVFSLDNKFTSFSI